MKILLLEDNDADADLFKNAIQKAANEPIEITQFATLDDAFPHINLFDIIVVDLSSSDSVGFSTVKKIYEVYPFIPMIVLSGYYNHESFIEAVSNGAHDYLIKGVVPPESLYRCIQSAIIRKRLEIRLVQASDNKSAFLSRMSHEIRTPLNGILGASDLLLQTKLSNVQKEYTMIVSSSSQNLLVLVNDILDFSKIEAGKIDLEIVETDLKLFLDEFLKPFFFLAEKKGITFKAEVCDLGCKIYVDPGRLGQIITNLVGNSIKFTSAGTVVVKVEAQNRDNKNIHLIIRVQDSGIGIPPEAKEYLFQPFSQVSSAITKKFGGTGLGLSISRRLVDLMGGQIEYESEYKKGTTFKVEVTLKAGAIIDPNLTPPVQDLENQSEITPLQGTILIAEDNQTNQLIISRMLEKMGLKFHIAANGKEVLAALRLNMFDLVLMDCQMPEMDGYEATREIRKLEWTSKNIPIIALTANAVVGDAKMCIEAGMNEFLTKPIKRQTLEAVLRSYLKRPCFENAKDDLS